MHLELERDRLYVTVDALILTVREGRLYTLLSRRKNPPFQGRWALPGRLVGPDEPVEATLDGLLAEMMPEGPRFNEQLYTFSDLNRDPRGRVISIAHLVAVPEAPSGGLTSFEIRLEGDALSLIAPGGGSLPGGELAFDHGGILATGVQRLRGKIDYTDIAFHFLTRPDCFSLGQLQSIFEAVLSCPVDPSNFRRMVKSRYEEPGFIAPLDASTVSPRGRGRPAAMYRVIPKNER